MPDFDDLQNGLYNFMVHTLGFTNENNFQFIQPGVAFPANTADAAVWSFMNEIPLLSLVEGGSGGNQFFSDYEALLSALKPDVNIDFAGDIGSAANTAWENFLANLPNFPAVTQLPSLFFSWAFTHGFSSVAAKGASDLSAMLLEPIFRAQLALQPYLSIPGVSTGKPPDWSIGYSDLANQLAGAPSKSAQSLDLQSQSDVSTTWTAGHSAVHFLLWNDNSNSSSSISERFASQAVTFKMSFDHALTFLPVPGAWFESSALGLAFGTQSGAPWNPADTEITWANTFGPNGNMQRFASSLIVVSGMNIEVTSATQFSGSDQTTIEQNKGHGFWPFYKKNSSSVITTNTSFNDQHQLTISQTSPPNVPILIGRTVLPAAQYVGFEAPARRQFLQLLSRSMERLAA
jgi:hypothetical protein